MLLHPQDVHSTLTPSEGCLQGSYNILGARRNTEKSTCICHCDGVIDNNHVPVFDDWVGVRCSSLDMEKQRSCLQQIACSVYAAIDRHVM